MIAFNGKLPVIMLLHPVGIGATRAMNVLSAKLWIRALVDLLPDAVISAPWLPYAEAMVDRDRGIRDALVTIDQFSCGVQIEWDKFGKLGLPRIDLTRAPLPALLSYETFGETRLPKFKESVVMAFQQALSYKRAA